jgi:hypothetical protein
MVPALQAKLLRFLEEKSAVTLNLPFSIYLFRRARRETWCSPRAAIALIPVALLAHGALFAGLMHFMYVGAAMHR